MSGKGVFGANRPIDEGCVALAFNSSVECAVGVGRNASDDFRDCGRSAARHALHGFASGEEPDVLMLMVDTRAGDLADAISGAYEVSGPSIPMAGGASGGAEP